MSRAAGYFTLTILALIGIGTAPASPDAPAISATELRDWQVKNNDLTLFDARNKKSFDSTHIQGAVLPLAEDFYLREELYQKGLSPVAPDPETALTDAMKAYPKDKPIVTYCNRDCQASVILAQQLRALGFKNVRYLQDGLQGWEEKGYPVTVGAPRLSSGSLGE